MDRCKGIILTCLIGCLSLGPLKAQESMDYQTVEQSSYALYLSKQWNELLELGNKSIENGIDYYYLRLRLGIACYELKHYRAAIPHFKKALDFSSGDLVAEEYLYYCYLYSERKEQAQWLSKSFPASLLTETSGHKNPMKGSVWTESGVKLSDSAGIFGPAYFSQLGVSHLVKKRVAVWHVLNWYYQDEDRFDVNQLQYYVRANLPLKQDWMLSTGIHSFGNASNYTETAVKESTFRPAPPFPGAPDPPVKTQTVTEVSTIHEQALGIAIAANLTKHLTLADVSAGASFLALDSARQLVASLSGIYYPFKNNRLSVGATAYLQKIPGLNGSKVACSPILSCMIGSRLYFSASYFRNYGLNIPEQTAYFLNNSVDCTTNRLTLNPIYMINARWSVYGLYSFETKKEIEKNFVYHYQVMVGGLKLNF